MDYSLFILSVCVFVESRIKSGIDFSLLEKSSGYSYRHIRETFKESKGITLSQYIRTRKIENAAFDIVHTDKNLIDIALEYGFSQYDGFTRAFKKETGITPSEFRKNKYQVGRQILAGGVFAPAILKRNGQMIAPSKTEGDYVMNDLQSVTDGCILMGVPKVEYQYGECTPFPSCLKACLNYMGQDVKYHWLLAASGAAFRLRWNTAYWDGGNVDIMYTYADPLEAFKKSFKAVGRNYSILKREDSDKQGFIDFIKQEIDNGRPVIAFGIIGPPEACIITGYEDSGNKLLGWNFFQSRLEYADNISFHDCGYFICDNWWENKETIMLMSIGEQNANRIDDYSILSNGYEIMKQNEPLTWADSNNVVACGQAAYDAWIEAITDESQFGRDIILPLLFERYMCQIDALTMVGEGRVYVSQFLKEMAFTYSEVHDLCMKASDYLYKAADICNNEMYTYLCCDEQQEETVRRFGQQDVRKKLAEMIKRSKDYEAKSMEYIEKILVHLQ